MTNKQKTEAMEARRELLKLLRPGGWAETGAYLGFPPCCVEHFCSCLSRGAMPPAVVGPGPWEGSGFIPCPDHATIAKEKGFDYIVGLINTPARKHPRPFPDRSV